MFSGLFQQTIDSKNRIVIPSKFRELIENEQDKKGFIITPYCMGKERYLILYPPTAWKKITSSWSAGSEKDVEMFRFISANAEYSNIGRQGRLVIPQKLLETASLKRNVMIAGIVNRIEVWNLEDWNSKYESIKKEYAQDLANIQKKLLLKL